MTATPTAAEPFADDAECLTALLAWLDLVLRARVSQVRAELGGDPWLRGLHIDDAEVDALLDRGPLMPPWTVGASDPNLGGAIAFTGKLLAERLDASPDAAWARLTHRFALDDLDAQALLLAVAVEFDPRYGRLVGWLHDDVTRRRPTVGLALDLFADGIGTRLFNRRRFVDGALVTSGLVKVEDGPTLVERVLTPAPGLVRWLVGEPPIDPAARPAVTLCGVDAAVDETPPGLADHRDRLVAGVGRGERRLVAVSGPPGSGRQGFARAIAARLVRPLYVLDVEPLAELEERPDFTRALDAAVLAARLDDAPLCLRRLDALDGGREPKQVAEQTARRRAVAQALADRGPRLTVVTVAAPWHPQRPPPGLPPVEQATIEALPVVGRVALWRAALGEGLTDGSPDGSDGSESDPLDAIADAIAGVADAFRFPPGRIRAAATTAHGFARAAGRPLPDGEQLFRAARAHATPQLGQLARRVETAHDWDDLVLAADRRAQLEEVIVRVRHRTQVLERWGFGRKVVGERGTSALFVGPPGTGKTMAAALIAAETQRDLYRIDLSQIVSKYIGETEKHLERTFAEAEATDAALFFDEADALFGKRGDVKDAHDRYANIEVGYLLQRLERFPGLVILATNLRKNIDEAFLRRMDVIVDFPLPDVEQRARLWARIWPAAAPLADDVDPADLAERFDVAGGHIRNIALSAAFAAAEAGADIGLSHVISAARSEYKKLNKLVDGRRFAPQRGRRR